jgi:FAD/FMN-containing dehydrogenase
MMLSDALTNDAIPALLQIVGPQGILTDLSDVAPYCNDWRRFYHGRTVAVVRPSTTREVADVVQLCAKLHIPVVPQGGNTGLVGGGVPSEDGRQIVLSLSRMNRIRDIDSDNMTITLDAGVTLKAAQNTANTAGCMLSLSLSSEGSAQIGGVLATNAGGNNTLRYGTARELVLGLEVVLAEGQIWDGLRQLRKDNTGYCLRQLFVGAEGTLGIITGAALKLIRRPRHVAVALCAVPSPEAALALFEKFQESDIDALVAFEYMSNSGMRLVLQNIPGTALPLSEQAPHYVLVELATPRRHADLHAEFEEVLKAALEARIVADAAIATSVAERQAIWRLREEHAESQKRAGASIHNDVSVAISKIPELLRRATEACQHLIPDVRVVPFGHMGDGNIHFVLVQPPDSDPEAFLARDHELMDAVNEVVHSLGGSFSAEHGIGKLKAYMMPTWRGGVELDTMRRIKHALDPLALMNPDKVLP